MNQADWYAILAWFAFCGILAILFAPVANGLERPKLEWRVVVTGNDGSKRVYFYKSREAADNFASLSSKLYGVAQAKVERNEVNRAAD